ncbi:hypothetical protein [Caviibacter abscessus]|uniref:hypothetical protein n=1 Tax=Caviibacter abscessus TaxID=1766719 RepID=UPI0008373AC8|nr:hypothetical protein [Caviibacter abscessus]
MKKCLILSFIGLALNSFSYKIVSLNERTFIDKVSVSSRVMNKIEDSFNNEKEIAVISKETNIKKHNYKGLATEDALLGLEKTISDFAYSELISYFKKSNLTGPGFDEFTFRKFANNIARNIMDKKLYTIAGAWQSENSGLYFVLVKIDRNIVVEESKKTFKERLEVIIDTLSELEGSIK